MLYLGHYLMELSIGTPSININGVVDMGSDLRWTQCEMVKYYSLMSLLAIVLLSNLGSQHPIAHLPHLPAPPPPMVVATYIPPPAAIFVLRIVSSTQLRQPDISILLFSQIVTSNLKSTIFLIARVAVSPSSVFSF
ncbi:hypothetical protein RIF29_15189 [Crotalaria pallida]|uniref:Peptidase A1 domain-containing protein n=1 Tax=Crotalaria pallida TaxID=3830 RepID=A0AAN9FEH8_CROPI